MEAEDLTPKQTAVLVWILIMFMAGVAVITLWGLAGLVGLH